MYETKTDKLEEEIDKSTVTVTDFRIPLSTIDRTTGKKVNKDIEFNKNRI